MRITISTSDAPHLLPSLPQLAKLAGGVYTIDRAGADASSVEVPLQPVR